MSQDLEERLVRLETLISMQDQMIEELNHLILHANQMIELFNHLILHANQMIEELNQVIITQQNELDKIKYEFQTISESMMNGGGDSSYANQKPPHYW